MSTIRSFSRIQGACPVTGLIGKASLRTSTSWKGNINLTADKCHENESQKENLKSSITSGIVATIIGTAGIFWWKSRVEHAAKQDKKLPVYSKIEVARHDEIKNRVWVTFKDNVYDITDFIAIHPGGSRIMMAAGSYLEPFWELYPVHQRDDILQMLEQYKIGKLRAEDLPEASEKIDHFEGEPERHPVLIPRSQKPFNGETPVSLLSEKFYTPNDLFYVRNHLPVPKIDLATYELEIDGFFLKEKTLSFDEIKKFPKVEIPATIQCGGNRRSEMNKSKPVSGLSWSGGAIGNAKWGGARLIDILEHNGFDFKAVKNPEKYHIQFEGYDSDQSGDCYGASVPLSFLFDRNFDAILAYEMNGQRLPIDHGFPVRVILPGTVGARNVKWLKRISISDEESNSPWQRRDYKVFSPSVTMNTVNFSEAPAITETPVTSFICSHYDGQKVKKGKNILKGYAFSGGGRDIIRVEISTNLGETWDVAKIVKKEKSGSKNWAWVQWESELDFKKGAVEVWVKAVDSGYNQQPESFSSIWNYRGLISNAYHKLKFTAQ